MQETSSSNAEKAEKAKAQKHGREAGTEAAVAKQKLVEKPEAVTEELHSAAEDDDPAVTRRQAPTGPPRSSSGPDRGMPAGIPGADLPTASSAGFGDAAQSARTKAAAEVKKHAKESDPPGAKSDEAEKGD